MCTTKAFHEANVHQTFSAYFLSDASKPQKCHWLLSRLLIRPLPFHGLGKEARARHMFAFLTNDFFPTVALLALVQAVQL